MTSMSLLVGRTVVSFVSTLFAALPDVPYCFDYWYDKKNPNSESLLIFGNDTGDINLMSFFKPVTQLFDIPFKSDGGAHKIFMQVRTFLNLSRFQSANHLKLLMCQSQQKSSAFLIC